MSKKTRRRQDRKAQSARRRAEQQAALLQTMGGPANRPSIAQLVMQRMDRVGILNQVPATLVQPQVKLASPDGKGMHTVAAPATTIPAAPAKEEEWPAAWPKCPTGCDIVEWRRALEAKDYYELAQLEDDGKKPWFQYPKHPYQYSEFVFVTEEMAAELLKFNPENRRIEDSWVESLKRDIIAEHWLQTHESIAINKVGNMHDGQHRAKAIVEAKVGWPIYCTWNVPPTSIYVTDSGKKRNINEKLNLLFPEHHFTTKTAALCRAMMSGLNMRAIKFSETEIAEFAVKHRVAINWTTKRVGGMRADFQAATAKAILWYGEPIVGDFIRRFKEIDFDGDGDPAKALFVWLNRAKEKGRSKAYTNSLVYYKKTLAAIVASAEGRDAKKIYAREEDIFNWEPGWEVPANAPTRADPSILPQLDDDDEEEEEDTAEE